ncbi:hypothetical protein BDV27DRAFT_125827 [Aspergillus caelatus]|uniref:Uncharacterized protein n=1 Tax=Aspergillus caelatus TaxID=61420 RepID=A0A5N7A9N2_9EURO|nr:uncharacterized protein BDV27DRAFT_125827 [Aspergillus caelatus]KAE8366078.1 hypothetical protein BDV27DRAFT_125827 [Aspergillus caelatus]
MTQLTNKHQPGPFNRQPTSKIKKPKRTSANSQLTTKGPPLIKEIHAILQIHILIDN